MKNFIVPFSSIWILDRIIKLIAIEFLSEKNYLLSSFLNFTLLFNHGSSLSLLTGSNHIEKGMLITVPLLVSIYMTYTYIKQFPIAIGIIMGGAFGNWFDRLVYGGVVDFISITILGHTLPVFNIADLCICAGIGYLILTVHNHDTTKH